MKTRFEILTGKEAAIRTCQIERVDDKHMTYLCNRDARFVWNATKDASVFLCPSCKNWLEIMESLGLRLL